MNLESNIAKKHSDLSDHPLYKKLTNLENLRVFMQYHVFAVWDFMSLLKSLQKEITCVEIPWTDSKYNPELVRLINEIVIGEESDLDPTGRAISHFSLYLEAMDEIGADTSLIKNFLSDFDFSALPAEIATMIAFHIDLAENAKVHEVAASFFYGREKLIPSMFTSIVKVLKDENLDCPSLIYYLERHIELDGDEHGPKALKCLSEILDSKVKKDEAYCVAKNSLDIRWQLWDFISTQIDSKSL